jgi:hypothetical protein
VRRTIAALVLALVAGPLAGCGGGDDPHAGAPSVASDATWTTIAAVDGASLARLSLSDGSHAYLQRIDLRRMRIEQVTGDRDPGAPEAGRYYPGAASPRFIRIPPDNAQRACAASFGQSVFSVVNFAFFEEYDRSTRLSFPAKSRGTLLTAGSSPYGPVANPGDPYYRGVTLQALTWTGSGAAIASYDPTLGVPLNDPAVVNGLVTYAYRDHPSYVLNHDPPNRYQLLALSDPQHLLILTLEHATLDSGADLLRSQGVAGEILTFDGGISTYLWQSTLGELVPITNGDGALPHYLCVTAAG